MKIAIEKNTRDGETIKRAQSLSIHPANSNKVCLFFGESNACKLKFMQITYFVL